MLTPIPSKIYGPYLIHYRYFLPLSLDLLLLFLLVELVRFLLLLLVCPCCRDDVEINLPIAIINYFDSSLALANFSFSDFKADWIIWRSPFDFLSVLSFSTSIASSYSLILSSCFFTLGSLSLSRSRSLFLSRSRSFSLSRSRSFFYQIKICKIRFLMRK